MCRFFFFNDTATTEIYTLSLHDALPISDRRVAARPLAGVAPRLGVVPPRGRRSEEHTSELQSHLNLVCRLLLEKKKINRPQTASTLTEFKFPRYTATSFPFPGSPRATRR